ncbi:uncharacterized protein EV154DRAFT_477815 [Mucor mucedo]|uniref:uncharacterized protein n=1 Tax=Mucor mucedo TaxID=29922 RepID=UPI002220048B|nr:uncharacterized protein EV154DRAFT_477815 [Mucor mucedo]KAI7895041.1 hypothetical protein EV154DRAFT_477815 [Mucor mucedo]
MQNNQIPPQRMFQPQVAYPTMANMVPSAKTQGVFSTYSARLKHSNDNALLLPESYLTKKTRFTGDESDEEFNDMMEESDEEDEEEDEENDKPAVEKPPRPVSLPAGSAVAPPPVIDYPKRIRKKNHLFYSFLDLMHISDIDEILVPIRLDIDVDSIKLRDRFLWNMNEQYLTPEKFGEMLCEDLELSPYRFIQPIAESIRAQVLDFESFTQVQLPAGHTRVVINLDLQIGKVNYRDQFEWELQNEKTNAPEVFSRQLAAELGVGGEYVAIISHAIREQLFRHKRQFFLIDGEIRATLDSAFRPVEEAKQWVPRMDMLSNDELEKLLISQERNIRRMRRETRFKRSTRRV